MVNRPLKIGILNLMHDKVDTQQRFEQVLTSSSFDVELTFLYPQTHYLKRPVPQLVQDISEPLDINSIDQFDAFIITGAPLEHLPFQQVTYLSEIQSLIDQLVKLNLPLLYICWGAMAAANYLYGIEKFALPEKIFGVFPNYLKHSDPLLKGLADGFLAPHARYAELNLQQIAADSRLIINALTVNHRLFSFRAKDNNQYFLFSHLEYDQDALLKEYLREKAAHPEIEYLKPQNYFRDPLHMKGTQFTWATTQQVFFKNWLSSVANDVCHQQLIKE